MLNSEKRGERQTDRAADRIGQRRRISLTNRLHRDRCSSNCSAVAITRSKSTSLKSSFLAVSAMAINSFCISSTTFMRSLNPSASDLKILPDRSFSKRAIKCLKRSSVYSSVAICAANRRFRFGLSGAMTPHAMLDKGFSRVKSGPSLFARCAALSNRERLARFAIVEDVRTRAVGSPGPLQNRYSAEIGQRIQQFMLDRLIQDLWVAGSNPSGRANNLKR
jgi:hypothetical protein